MSWCGRGELDGQIVATSTFVVRDNNNRFKDAGLTLKNIATAEDPFAGLMYVPPCDLIFVVAPSSFRTTGFVDASRFFVLCVV